ncbi:Hemoglobin-like protein HbO [hydrothermal vent metagenome]|uniref:Hemoglobin-like protein HbO n=1 Tax=hydrothermal vent metagenome TaxID=652676 RepID=A0A3B0WXT0_9ZZZZ
MSKIENQYGTSDASYKAAGELEGLTRLVDDFYDQMSTLPEANIIRAMHPKDLTLSRKKLVYFLSGWLGGPSLYAEHFGGISIPMSHQHLPIGKPEGDAWLLCMEKALEKQPYEPSFKTYLLEQLKFPTERIQAVCAHHVSR